MNKVKVSQAMPLPKRAHGFSIESIMRKDEDRDPVSSSDDSDSGDDTARKATPPNVENNFRSVGARIPPLHPALPVHVQQLLLSDPVSRANQEILSQRSHELAFGTQLNILSSATVRPTVPFLGYAGQYAPTSGAIHPSSAFHPSLLASSVTAGRDPMAMVSPWFLNKTVPPALLNYPYGNYNPFALYYMFARTASYRRIYL